jgi:hypothetical protein
MVTRAVRLLTAVSRELSLAGELIVVQLRTPHPPAMAASARHIPQTWKHADAEATRSASHVFAAMSHSLRALEPSRWGAKGPCIWR